MASNVQLWWIEPAPMAEPGRRSFRIDRLIAFGFSAVLGLAGAEESGHTVRVPLGGGIDVSMPAQPWQYGLWLLIFLAGGALCEWIMALGGRAEVSLRDDGVLWLLGRATRRFYPYALMQRCELLRTRPDGVLVMRLTMQPERSGDPVRVREVAIPRRIDAGRIAGILRAAGVSTSGWPIA